MSELRIEGQNATATQIQRACTNVGNQIFNGEFELASNTGNALGWTFSADSTSIYFLDYADSTQHTPGGSREGRFVSEDATATARIYQPITLCPNATYALSSWIRQARSLAECTATFSIGSAVLGTIMPAAIVWQDTLFNAANYTVGPAVADASQDFVVSVQCAGSGDANDERTIDIDDLSLEAILSS